MQGILETPGHTVAGNLDHGRVKVVPFLIGSGIAAKLRRIFHN
jgi:hypothetical protein